VSHRFCLILGDRAVLKRIPAKSSSVRSLLSSGPPGSAAHTVATDAGCAIA
jgi:hypothetical protein